MTGGPGTGGTGPGETQVGGEGEAAVGADGSAAGSAGELGRPPGARGASSRWRRSRVTLDPLALLLRERFGSRAELARVSGLDYERLRTYTDGLWRSTAPPPPDVLAGLGLAVGPEQVQAAVLASLAQQLEQGGDFPALSWGQRVVLEALREFDDAILVDAAPHVHDLLAGLAQTGQTDPGDPGATQQARGAAGGEALPGRQAQGPDVTDFGPVGNLGSRDRRHAAAAPTGPPTAPRFLTLQQAADELNVSHSQVYALVRDRSVIAVKIGGRGQWRVERARLEQYIDQLYRDAETSDPAELPGPESAPEPDSG